MRTTKTISPRNYYKPYGRSETPRSGTPCDEAPSSGLIIEQNNNAAQSGDPCVIPWEFLLDHHPKEEDRDDFDGQYTIAYAVLDMGQQASEIPLCPECVRKERDHPEGTLRRSCCRDHHYDDRIVVVNPTGTNLSRKEWAKLRRAGQYKPLKSKKK